MRDVDRSKVNERLTDLLAGFGVEPDEADDDVMNDLSHGIADFIDSKHKEQS